MSGVYQVRLHASARAFLERAEAWLLRAEDHHNLVLSLSHALAEREAEPTEEVVGRGPFYATIEAAGEVVGCALRSPPHKVLVTEMPLEAAAVLAAGLVVAYDHIPAVLGPREVAEEVAVAWVRARGGGWRPGMEQGIYRLDQATPPSGVPGRMRLARAEDLELAIEWGEGFARDAGVQFATSRVSVTGWLERGQLYLWEVEGRPVSVAVAQGRTPHGIRIGYVYTPPEHRRRGYAGALVAALSGEMLDGGIDFCVLYTDLSNPTSNAIYRRVGYELIERVQDIDIVGEDRL